ncbi:hypothetical protein [Pseudaminobacter salicylatoxidans]|nr:hypothetical protein [Pseudaminobacter salicylatoxidans]
MELPIATIPAIDHAAVPAKAVPKAVINSGRNKRRKDFAQRVVLINA